MTTIIKAHFDGTAEPRRFITGEELANSSLAGLWKDRTDIGDSLEYARKLRKKCETRHHQILEVHAPNEKTKKKPRKTRRT